MSIGDTGSCEISGANYSLRQFVFSLVLEITTMGGHEDERQKATRKKGGYGGIISRMVWRKQNSHSS